MFKGTIMAVIIASGTIGCSSSSPSSSSGMSSIRDPTYTKSSSNSLSCIMKLERFQKYKQKHQTKSTSEYEFKSQ